MTRVISVLLVLILIAAGAAFLLMPNLLNGEVEENAPFAIIPDDAALILEINNTSDMEMRTLSQAYGEALFATQLGKSYQAAKKLRRNVFQDFFDSKQIDSLYLGVSVHLSTHDQYECLYYSRCSSSAIDAMEESLKSFGASSHLSDKSNIYKLTLDGETYALTFLDDFLVLSSNTSLVESSAARNAGSGNSVESESFKKVSAKANSDAVLNMYINFKGLASLASVFAGVPFQKEFKSLNTFGEWTAMELFPSEDGLQLSGFANPSESLLSISKDQGANHDELAKVLSSRTVWFVNAGMGGVDSLDYFYSRSWSMTEPLDTQFAKYSFTHLHIKNEEAVSNMLEPTGEELSTIGAAVYHSGPFDTYGFNGAASVATIYGGYLILANSISDLNRMCRSYSSGSTLETVEYYQGFASNINSKSDLLLYFNSTSASKLFDLYGHPFWNEEIDEGSRTWSQLFSPLFVSWSYNSDLIYTNALLQYGSEVSNSVEGEIWSFEMDTTSTSIANIVYNHNSKDLEVVIQDEANRIYHLSHSGELLWKRTLDGPILGEVLEVDFYKNDKVQFLFNTSKKVYIIDRKGRDVANYPFNLPSEAVGPMSLVDYGGSKAYRLFVPSSNGIYGFESNGKPLNGWRPRKDVGILASPLRHYDVEGKDFLVCMSTDGQWTFMNRKGKSRFDNIEVAISDFEWDDISKQWTSIDSLGFFAVNADGEKSRLDIELQQRGQWAYYQSDSGMHGVGVDTMDWKMKLITSSTTYESGVTPGNYEVGKVMQRGLKGTWYYVYEAEEAMIYLIDENGGFVQPFPSMAASVPVIGDLYKDKLPIIVLINGNKLLAKSL